MTADLVQRVARRSLPVVSAVAALSALHDWRTLPPAIVLGAGVGLVHLKGVGITARSVARGSGATGLLWLFSTFRLMVVALLLFLPIRFLAVDPLGLLAGLFTVYSLVLVEGWIDARRTPTGEVSKAEEPGGRQSEE